MIENGKWKTLLFLYFFFTQSEEKGIR